MVGGVTTGKRPLYHVQLLSTTLFPDLNHGLPTGARITLTISRRSNGHSGRRRTHRSSNIRTRTLGAPITRRNTGRGNGSRTGMRRTIFRGTTPINSSMVIRILRHITRITSTRNHDSTIAISLTRTLSLRTTNGQNRTINRRIMATAKGGTRTRRSSNFGGRHRLTPIGRTTGPLVGRINGRGTRNGQRREGRMTPHGYPITLQSTRTRRRSITHLHINRGVITPGMQVRIRGTANRHRSSTRLGELQCLFNALRHHTSSLLAALSYINKGVTTIRAMAR